jgi:Undecaprenyl-phosphate galactose phosphotransferase WbaP
MDHPNLGYSPVVIIDGFSSSATLPTPIPHYQEGNISSPNKMHSLDGVKTAILITSEIPKNFMADVVEGRWHKFHHLIMISGDQNGGSVWIEPHDIGGIVGLEVKQNLFNDVQQFFKRVVDLGLVILLSPIAILLFVLLAALIKINSPGPVFYRQKRIGKDGKEFIIWKFRTMLEDADQNFKKYLEQNSDHKAEWEKNQKIKNDPRVTQVGKLMRRLSLDELPQIINILQGDMSLVGPRPIVEEEVQYYGNRIHLYTKVKPGLTGLWQVSGRNDTTYEQRVRFDEYYVRNWSIWIDIYILAQTIGAVLGGKGAY